MNYKVTIGKAWEFTHKHKKLILWYGFVPSIFTTTYSVGYIAYNFFAFKTSHVFGYTGKHGFLYQVFNFIADFIKANFSLTIPLIIIALLSVALWFILPTLCQAAAVQYISRKSNNQPATLGTGMRYGLFNFLPLLELHAILKTMSVFAITMEGAFVLRNLGTEAFKMISPVFILILAVGMILSLFLAYADFFIIIDNEKVFLSIWKSMRLVILNWQKTFLVSLLMILIGLRIIIQIVVLLLIPSLVIFVAGYISMVWVATIGYIVAGVIGLAALLFAAYLSGVIDIFSYTVWTYTFLDLTSQKEISAREVMDQKSLKLLPEEPGQLGE